MKVYILTQSIPYDADEILGVFDNDKDAMDEGKRLAAEGDGLYYPDRFVVGAYEMNKIITLLDTDCWIYFESGKGNGYTTVRGPKWNG